MCESTRFSIFCHFAPPMRARNLKLDLAGKTVKKSKEPTCSEHNLIAYFDTTHVVVDLERIKRCSTLVACAEKHIMVDMCSR